MAKKVNFLVSLICASVSILGKSSGMHAGHLQGTILQPQITSVCILSERTSGSTWLAHLLEENFELASFACPPKHDYGMESPSSFLALPPTILVLVNIRNALDWAPSMYRSPWGANSHCHLTWNEFLEAEWGPGDLAEKLPEDAYHLGTGSFQISVERYKTEFPDSFCNKTETRDIRHGVVYERQEGRYARNILELRAWKAKRAIELLQVRRQSFCVRHEDVLANTTGWLVMLQTAYHLKAKPAFPIQVKIYKGELGAPYMHHSELELLRDGNESLYWNSGTSRFLRDNLDLELESNLGYQYKVLEQLSK